MKLIANGTNGVYFRDILPKDKDVEFIDNVLAAIAYGSSFNDSKSDLLGQCLQHKLRLDLWMRYDHTVPVAVPLLKRLHKHQRDNIFTKFVRDWFHPKVIWWKGYGAYIGSANLTDRAWNKNIEVGVFVTDDEITSQGLGHELETVFEYLAELDNTIPLSDRYIRHMEELTKINKGKNEAGKKARLYEFWDGPNFVDKINGFNKRKRNFQYEWESTLGILENISSQILEYRPDWIPKDIPVAWEVDQFLHAYYYNKVGEKKAKPYENYFRRNCNNPNYELQKQLLWWLNTKSAPSNEDKNFAVNGPLLRDLLSIDKVLNIDVAELELVCRNTHATSEHVSKIPLKDLGRPDLKTLKHEQRFNLFAPFLIKQRNKMGWDIRQLLNYVLYDSNDRMYWERLYNAGKDPNYRIERYGLNSLAEVFGWVRPEIAPPRNGRTSKALRALGFDVKIY